MTKPRSLQSLLGPKPVAATLPLHLRAALGRAVILAACLFAPILASYAIPGNDFGIGSIEYVAPEHGAAAQAEVDVEVARADRIVERRGCWTGEAPADVTVPGGVVMSVHGGRVHYYGDAEHVAQALDHLFAQPDPQVGAVVGFCR